MKKQIDKAYSEELIESLGYDFLEKMLSLQSFEDACKIEKLDPKKVIPDFSCYPKKDRKSMIAHAELVIMMRSANRLANDNKEWIVNFDNRSQRKYEPDFLKTSSGLRYGDCYIWDACANIGSRLCSISASVCEYMATQFIDKYTDYLL